MAGNTTWAEFSVEYWKLLRAFERTIERLPPEHVARTAAQLRFSAGRLDALVKEGGLRLVTFDGQAYEPSLPATALNADDFGDGDRLAIEATVEPAVIQDMAVLLLGKVVLKQIEDGEDDVSRN